MGYSLKAVKAVRFCRTKWKPRKGRDFLFPSFLSQEVLFMQNVKQKDAPLFGAQTVHMKHARFKYARECCYSMLQYTADRSIKKELEKIEGMIINIKVLHIWHSDCRQVTIKLRGRCTTH